MQKKLEEVSYLKIDSQTENPRSIIFLCHGYAQRASHMLNIVGKKLANIFPDLAIYSIDGFHECVGHEGRRRYDWLRFNTSESSPQTLKEAANHSAAKINNFTSAIISESNLSHANAMLVGFSQGTRICLHSSLRSPSQYKAVLGYSGALSFPEYLVDEIKSKPKIMLIHGDEDNILPAEESIQAYHLLKNIGVDAKLEIVHGLKHEINDQALLLGTNFIKNMFKLP